MNQEKVTDLETKISELNNLYRDKDDEIAKLKRDLETALHDKENVLKIDKAQNEIIQKMEAKHEKDAEMMIELKNQEYEKLWA